MSGSDWRGSRGSRTHGLSRQISWAQKWSDLQPCASIGRGNKLRSMLSLASSLKVWRRALTTLRDLQSSNLCAGRLMPQGLASANASHCGTYPWRMHTQGGPSALDLDRCQVSHAATLIASALPVGYRLDRSSSELFGARDDEVVPRSG